MRTPCLVLGLALLLASPCQADEIVLTNGRSLKGQILSQGDWEGIKIRMPYGVITVPKKHVARIRRESHGALFLNQAQQAAADGDAELARKLYEKTLRREDGPLAAEARQALRRLGPVAPATASPAAAPPLHEAHGPKAEALARLRGVGTDLGDGEGWETTITPRFVLFARDAELATSLPSQCDAALEHVQERLGLRLREGVRIVVTVFPTLPEYRSTVGARSWSAGHAWRRAHPGAVTRVVATWAAPSLDDLLRHELAHILVGDAYAGQKLPKWDTEGVANYAESQASRTRANRRAAQRYAEGRTQPLPALFLSDYGRLRTLKQAIRFYDHAGLVFETLADLVGVPRSLEFALDEREGGQRLALSRLELSIDELEALVEAAAKRSASPEER
jgi:hypothetical protein